MQCKECLICHEKDTNDFFTLSCSHEFHKGCLNKWIKVKQGIKTCPLCRNEICCDDVLFKIKNIGKLEKLIEKEYIALREVLAKLEKKLSKDRSKELLQRYKNIQYNIDKIYSCIQKIS